MAKATKNEWRGPSRRRPPPAAIVRLVVPVERAAPSHPRTITGAASVPIAALAVVLVVAGLVLVATGGVWGRGSTFFAGVAVPPVLALATLASGAGLLRGPAVGRGPLGTLPR